MRLGWSEADRDGEAAERLLDGRDAGSDVARLLAAAARPLPGRPEDEAAALAAFRRAGAGAGAANGSRRRGPRRGFTFKAVAGGATAVLVIGGAAIAAQGAGLARPFHHGHAVSPGHTAPVPTSPAPSAAPSGPTRGPSARPTAPVTSTPDAAPAPTVPAVPSASAVPPGSEGPGTAAGLRGLCVSYLRQEAGASGERRLDAASLARLTRAAGGPAHLHAYCVALTARPLSLTLDLTLTPSASP